FYDGQPRGEEGVAEGHPVLDGQRRGFVLKTVARAHLDHGDPRWRLEPGQSGVRFRGPGEIGAVHGYSNSTSIAPGAAMSPGFTVTARTPPSRGARSAFSIFIASTTTSSWPRVTGDPGATRTAMTLPGMGASSAPRAPRGARAPPRSSLRR